MKSDSRSQRGSPCRSIINENHESDEITIIPAEIGVRQTIFPFTFQPHTISTTGNLQRRYQIRHTPPRSIGREKQRISATTIDNEKSDQIRQSLENDATSFTEGITIIPAVPNENVDFSTATVSIRNQPSIDSRALNRVETLSPHTIFNIDNGESTSSNVANGTESRISSLSLHASSVESSVMTEWVSIAGVNFSGSESLDQTDGFRSIHNVVHPPLLLPVEGICETASHVRSDVSQSDVSAQEKVCGEDSELESLSSFLGEINQTRQEQASDYVRRDSSSQVEPWYTNLETDLDWEVFREHARNILSALENNDDLHKESEEVRLARLILEEESCYWKVNVDEEGDKDATDGATKTISLQRKWRKLAGDLALTGAIAAAVASISYSVLAKRKT